MQLSRSFGSVLLSWVSWFILVLTLGWNVRENLRDCDKARISLKEDGLRRINLFPHTTKWDPNLFFLMRWAYDLKQDIAVIDSPWVERRFIGWVLKRVPGLIAVHSKGGSGQIKDGSLARLILESYPAGFTLWIAPVGRLVGTEWKTGFYFLARQLRATITVVGFDYSKQCGMDAGIHIRPSEYESNIPPDCAVRDLLVLHSKPVQAITANKVLTEDQPESAKEAVVAEVESYDDKETRRLITRQLQDAMKCIVPLYPMNSFPMCTQPQLSSVHIGVISKARKVAFLAAFLAIYIECFVLRFL